MGGLFGGAFLKNDLLGIVPVDPRCGVLPTVPHSFPIEDAFSILDFVSFYSIDEVFARTDPHREGRDRLASHFDRLNPGLRPCCDTDLYSGAAIRCAGCN